VSLLSWLGQKIKLTDGKFWSVFLGGETWAGETVTAETAMQVSAFWACVRLISRTVSTLPLGVYERVGDEERVSRSDVGLYRLIHDQPNADQTACEFWEAMVAWTLLAGTAFSRKQYAAGSRRLVGLSPPLNPHSMQVERRDDGALQFRYRTAQGKEEIYAEDDVFCLRGWGLGGDVGLSPLQYARQSLSSARATERAAASHFANGMRPSGWLVYKGGVLEPDQRETARQNLINPMVGAANAGKIGLLEGDFDFRQMTIEPEAAQMLESRRHSVEDVCRWHGVPPILIGHSAAGMTAWGSGIEQIVLGWYTLQLRPDLVRLEQAIKRQLMTPDEKRSLYVEHSIEGLLRADTAARGEWYWKLFQMGAINGTWMAKKENLPKPPGGDRYYINQTLAALDEQGIPIKAQDAPAAAESNPASPPAPPRLEVVR
jgi:HK97 family phage portal protein